MDSAAKWYITYGSGASDFPSGVLYLVDEDGNYLVDEDGNYLILEKTI